MKYSFLGLSILLFLGSDVAQAQRKDFLTFQNTIFDFGTVQESAGPVTHTFEFENSSDRPVKILSVKPSCGCTTPDWTKDVVKPGGKGSVTATFDPKARPGFFNKTLTLTTDFNGESIILNIKGTVSLKNDHGIYREANGNWRLLSAAFNMGKVLLKEGLTWKEFEVVNAAESPITVKGAAIAPAHIKVEIYPTVLQPGEKALIRIGYNGRQKNAYGFQSDNIEFITDDEAMPRKSFSVHATLEDFFPELTKEEQLKAPRLVIAEPAVDLGRFPSTASIEKQITLTNTGKKELSFRAIQANCQCVTVSTDTNTLAAGKSLSLTLRFNPEKRKGTQQKFVTLYTNDPANPVQRISIMAYVEN